MNNSYPSPSPAAQGEWEIKPGHSGGLPGSDIIKAKFRVRRRRNCSEKVKKIRDFTDDIPMSFGVCMAAM